MQVKDFSIYVFSATGNTMKCAVLLAKCLEELGAVTALYDINKTSAIAPGENLVICYPIHGFNVPIDVLRFCRKLPKHKGPVYFLKTSGEPLKLNDASSLQVSGILKKKGYDVRGEFHYVMPYNMVFRHTDEMASKMWQTASGRIPSAAAIIAAGERADVRPTTGARLMSALCRIEHGFYPLNGRLFRVKDDLCARCMRCVNECPVGNIRYENGKIRFGGSCTGCARCSFNCPKDAIRVGLLDFMRVNGPYDFSRDASPAETGRFRRAYERYFSSEDKK